MKAKDLNTLKKIIDQNPEWVAEFNNYKPASKMIPMIKKIPFYCPVCHGRGSVPAGFYARSLAIGSTSPEQCKSCDGTGIVWN